VLLTTLATAVGVFTMTTLAQTNSTTTATDNTVTSDNSQTQTTTNQSLDGMQFAGNMIMDQGFGGRQDGGFMCSIGNFEVSTEYTANVNSILNNDTDVQALITQGYNVTSINPIVKNVIEGNGTLSTQATTATVTMQNGTAGYATVNVDVTNAKVTQIVTITRTVIDKSSS
jgi:hypothetical protein